jgi:carboxyl-terminal processing protease
MNKQKLHIWLPLLFSVTMSIGIFIGFKMRDNFPDESFFYHEKSNAVREVLSLIKNKYVDNVDAKNLADTAIEAILSKLDPHSHYIPPTELEDINDDIQGNFYGVGFEFEIYNDTLNMLNIMEGGPAEKAGLTSGDQLISVNEKNVAGQKIEVDSMRKLLRGNRGSAMKLGILRNKKKLSVTVTRGLVPVNSVDASFMIDSSNGYIKINKFSTQTYHDFMTALTALNKKGMKNLILDLRDNGGGVLDEAIEIADEFLEGDKLITYTEGKHAPKKEYRCRRQGQFEKGQLFVLSNEGSASASEVLMGALQDWDRATIIGSRSFGKGLVQEQFDLSDKGALRLTVARYYTPTGRSIQRSYHNGTKAYYDETENNNYNADSLHKTGKTFKSPSGKKLYAGGGIMPDLTIPVDTNNISDFFSEVVEKGILNHFAFQYSIIQKAKLTSFKNPSDFAANFFLSDNDWNLLLNDIQSSKIDIKICTPLDKKILLENAKYMIANMIWQKNGYYQTKATEDKDIKKALELVSK